MVFGFVFPSPFWTWLMCAINKWSDSCDLMNFVSPWVLDTKRLVLSNLPHSLDENCLFQCAKSMKEVTIHLVTTWMNTSSWIVKTSLGVTSSVASAIAKLFPMTMAWLWRRWVWVRVLILLRCRSCVQCVFFFFFLFLIVLFYVFILAFISGRWGGGGGGSFPKLRACSMYTGKNLITDCLCVFCGYMFQVMHLFIKCFVLSL